MEDLSRHLKERNLQADAFSSHNFFELESIEPDRAVIRLVIHPENLNPYGMLHGGILYALADDAGGSASHSTGQYYVTQSGTLHFLHNQGSGIVRATATVRHRGSSTCLVVVDITNEDGLLLATGELSYFCVDKALMDQKTEES